MEMETIANMDCDQRVKINVLGKCLDLDLLMHDAAMEPLFSGAAWAGTIVWDAAIELANLLLSNRFNVQNCKVVELGAGIGVPGMIASVAGANQVVVTEQSSLLGLLSRNIASNELKNIQAQRLSWSRKDAMEFMEMFPSRFDYVLSCDCIYEPLYGESWKLLADTIVVMISPTTIVLVAVERRNQDGIESFLKYIVSELHLNYECIKVIDKSSTIEIYQIRK